MTLENNLWHRTHNEKNITGTILGKKFKKEEFWFNSATYLHDINFMKHVVLLIYKMKTPYYEVKMEGKKFDH